MAALFSRRTTTILLTLLGLFLLGTVVVLTTVNAYFSIDNSAYILPEELGTWADIRFGGAPADSWTAKIPLISKLTGTGSDPSSQQDDDHSQAWKGLKSKPYDPSNPPEKIPRIIHQTWKDEHLPPRWEAVRDECTAMHPDYEYMLWTDADSRRFIEEHYPWFTKVFDEYPYPIQRADAIRYFVLHHYGGVYMDLDIGCVRPLDPLLRFEIILPKTIPVGVSNDLMFAAKGHPFMDQLIHNLMTFNHQYLSNYPTVMFSTGPMFVSASYGLYVDVHGPAIPSTPAQPDAGFSGIRVLPKSLYGKNAKPGEAPDAFFRHFYGSSWHANDAGFLIFLRDHGRFLMFIGACIVGYGAFRIMLPKIMFLRKGDRSGSRRRRSDRGRWIGLPVGTRSTSPSSSSLLRSHSKRKSHADDSVQLDEFAAEASSSSTSAPGSRLSMPAPRPHRLSLPLFQLQEQDSIVREPQSVFAWVGQTLSRPSSRNEASSSDACTTNPTDGQRGKKKSGAGVLYLPAYFVSRGDDSSSQLSPSSSSSSSPPAWQSNSSSLGGWAASLLPASWRGPSPAPSASAHDVDLESVGSASDDESDYRRRYASSSATTTTKEIEAGAKKNRLLRRLPSSNDLHADEDTTAPPPYAPATQSHPDVQIHAPQPTRPIDSWGEDA